jgi:hypothetical protein
LRPECGDRESIRPTRLGWENGGEPRDRWGKKLAGRSIDRFEQLGGVVVRESGEPGCGIIRLAERGLDY